MTWRKEMEELDDFMEWCWICDCSFQHLYNKSERPNTRIMFISVSSSACIRNGGIPWHDGSMNEELVPVSWRCITPDLCSAVICVIYSVLTFSDLCDLFSTVVQSTNWNRVIGRKNDPFVCNVSKKSCTVGWSMTLICSHMSVIFRIPERYQNTAWSGIQSFRNRRFSPEYREDIIGHIATEVYRNVAVRCVHRFK